MSQTRQLADLLNANGQITAEDLSVGQIGGRRNLIINGAMQVWQRQTSANGGSLGAFVWTADRFWLYGPSTTSGTVGQSTDVPANQGFSYSIHNDTDNACSIGTNVELLKTGDAGIFYSGQKLTLSLWVKGTSSTTTTIQYSFRDNSGGTGNVVAATNGTLNITTEWNRVEIPLTITGTPNANNKAFQFEFSMPVGFKITGVQLEVGTVATPFEHRSYGEELALCQRYFLTLTDSGIRIPVVRDNDSTIATALLHLPTPLRASPTLTGTLSKVGVDSGFSFGSGTATLRSFQQDFPAITLYGSSTTATTNTAVLSATDLQIDAEL